jgi:hypothetical protein
MRGYGLSKEFWLNLTNSVLGSLILVFLVLVAIGLILDAVRRLRKRLSPNDTRETPSDLARIGITLVDGGETLREENHLCSRNEEKPADKPESDQSYRK